MCQRSFWSPRGTKPLTSSVQFIASTLLSLDDTLLELLPTGVCVCDSVGRIVLFNRKAIELWGRSPDEDEDRHTGAHRLFTPEGLALSAQHSPCAEALRSGQMICDRELVIERPDGGHFWALSNVQPIRDGAAAFRARSNA